MKRPCITRFSFIAISSLPLVLGFPGQARAATDGEGLCDGFPIYHTVEGKPGNRFDPNETYWALSVKYYGSHKYDEAIHWSTKHSDGSIIAPEQLKVGDVIAIPCLDGQPADGGKSWREAFDTADQPADTKKVVAKTFVPPPHTSITTPELHVAEWDGPSDIPTVSANDFGAESLAIPVRNVVLLKPVPPESTLLPARPGTLPTPVVKPKSKTTTAKTQSAKLSRKKAQPPKHFAVTLTIPPADVTADGMVPGTFPALVLADQKPNGEYGVRHEMTARIATDENGATVCRLVFSKRPTKDTTVTIDLQNGLAYPIPGEVILKRGGDSGETVPPLANKKAYALLKTSFPKKQNRVFAALRFVLPIAPQAAIAAATMNPLAIASVPITLATEIGMKKIANNQRAVENAQYPSLHFDAAYNDHQEQIDALTAKIAQLQQQVDAQSQQQSISTTTTLAAAARQ